MKPVKAVIFDMDGVIVDSEPLHERAFRDVFHEMGIGDRHGMDFAAYYGRSDRALWHDFVAKHRPTQPLDQLVDWKQRRFIELVKKEEPIFPGLMELLEQLAPRYPLAVASGSAHPVIDQVLVMKNLGRFFSFVVSVQDVAHPKPAPDVFLRAAELLRVKPDCCCVIEDSAVGVEAAVAAGMFTIAITNTLPADKLRRANCIVDSYPEIAQRLVPADND